MMNIQGLMKQAQMMQKKMEEAQAKLARTGTDRNFRRRHGQNYAERQI